MSGMFCNVIGARRKETELGCIFKKKGINTDIDAQRFDFDSPEEKNKSLKKVAVQLRSCRGMKLGIDIRI